MSSTTSTKTKAAALAHVQALIAGTTKHFPNGSFTIGGTVYTAASLIQVLQDLANAMTARNAAQTGAKDALAAEHAAQTQVGPILLAYKRLVLATFASATPTLADFGLAPPKARTPLTTEQRAARAASRVGTPGLPGAPLTEPDLWATHPALRDRGVQAITARSPRSAYARRCPRQRELDGIRLLAFLLAQFLPTLLE
jgi:hypothetical protein